MSSHVECRLASLSCDLIKSKFCFFDTVCITNFERDRYRALPYYKQKYPSRGATYTGDIKEKAKFLENYL